MPSERNQRTGGCRRGFRAQAHSEKETDNPKPNGAHVSDRGREGGRPGRARSPTVIPALATT